MDVRQLQMFIAVSEEGSIHGGARRLMMAQPALSKSLRALERQLGTELLRRSPRGIELTAAGKVMLEQSYEIVRVLDTAADLVREAGRGQKTLQPLITQWIGLCLGVDRGHHSRFPTARSGGHDYNPRTELRQPILIHRGRRGGCGAGALVLH